MHYGPRGSPAAFQVPGSDGRDKRDGYGVIDGKMELFVLPAFMGQNWGWGQ